MKAYKITASKVYSNAVVVGANNSEKLGAFYGVYFLTLDTAKAAVQELNYGVAPVFCIEESELSGLVTGEKYSYESVIDAGYSITELGYAVADYFAEDGTYLGADIHGVEPT